MLLLFYFVFKKIEYKILEKQVKTTKDISQFSCHNTNVTTREVNEMSQNNSNQPAAKNAYDFLNNFKYEVANELGINNYQNIDKGQLTSRENGYVGGYMVKKMVQYAEQNMPSNTMMQSGYQSK